MLTIGDVFRRVKTHLQDQGERSWDKESETCFYRHPDFDLKCAVGCLIADEHYDKNIEGEPVQDEFVIETLARSLGGQPT